MIQSFSEFQCGEPRFHAWLIQEAIIDEQLIQERHGQVVEEMRVEETFVDAVIHQIN